MLNSIGKDGGSQIKGNVMLIVLVDFFFLKICYLLLASIHYAL